MRATHDIVQESCGTTFRMPGESRFRPHFDFLGDFSRRFGLFAGCGGQVPFDTRATPAETSGCC